MNAFANNMYKHGNVQPRNIPINDHSNRSRLIIVLNDQYHGLVKDAPQLFVGNEYRPWFNVRNGMGPPVLVNGNLGIEEEGQLVGADKGVFVFGHRVRQSSSDGIAVKNIFLQRRRCGRSRLFRVKDAANGGTKEVTQLTLFAEFLAIVVVVVRAILVAMAVSRGQRRLYRFLRHEFGPEFTPIVSHTVFELTLNVSPIRVLFVAIQCRRLSSRSGALLLNLNW